ncbi:hypothetical protein CISG_08656 [Coccidioides immitis RMSCC 3703]|uniref:SUI1 domain-containing protein n=1 Tax=Coccidioides immitis RMSCC 3703 TaxID=454286 RepID=A0A0J8U273_COCIT|nr:hypothetical protein CISG_08656 [Coccidioides immitis RMSCC 3703]
MRSLVSHPFAEADEDTGDTKQSQNYIHIRIQQRNGRKTLTTVQGLPKKFDQKKILKVIKKKFVKFIQAILNQEEPKGHVYLISLREGATRTEPVPTVGGYLKVLKLGSSPVRKKELETRNKPYSRNKIRIKTKRKRKIKGWPSQV